MKRMCLSQLPCNKRRYIRQFYISRFPPFLDSSLPFSPGFGLLKVYETLIFTKIWLERIVLGNKGVLLEV